MEDLTDYLSAQMSSSDYREIVIIVYQDGRIATYQDDANTSSSFHISIPYTVEDNPKYYYPQALDANGNLIEKNRIRYIAHTQLSGHTPSSGDLNYSKDYQAYNRVFIMTARLKCLPNEKSLFCVSFMSYNIVWHRSKYGISKKEWKTNTLFQRSKKILPEKRK